MATNKPCSCGCGKSSVKDGLSGKCYRKKHGVPAYPPKAAGEGKPMPPVKLKPHRVKAKRLIAVKERQVAQGGAEIGLAVNFTEYPRVHARLIDLARQEHRTPELQIVHILDTRFGVDDVMVPVKAQKRLKTA